MREILADREIMPATLREFYARARAETFASDMPSIKNPMIPGSTELRYKEGNFYYHDRYFDNEENPGRFVGMEIVSEGSYEGQPLSVYSYAGGLTERGSRLGESTVYERLKKFLQKNAQTARFGGKVRDLLKDEVGIWIYESKGMVTRWGWADVEYLNLEGDLVYEFQGEGTCLDPGF